ncbi:hypothetical protein Tco_0844561 [Tanacetum coccineum]
MTKSYGPFKQSEVFSVFSATKNFSKILNQYPLQYVIDRTPYHDAGPFSGPKLLPNLLLGGYSIISIWGYFGDVRYESLRLSEIKLILDGVHDTFHVSNLKKCLADPTLQVPMDEIQVDAKLNFVEEPVEILEKEFKKLKRSRISIVKVRWNSKCGPEFTWERED